MARVALRTLSVNVLAAAGAAAAAAPAAGERTPAAAMLCTPAAPPAPRAVPQLARAAPPPVPKEEEEAFVLDWLYDAGVGRCAGLMEDPAVPLIDDVFSPRRASFGPIFGLLPAAAGDENAPPEAGAPRRSSLQHSAAARLFAPLRL